MKKLVMGVLALANPSKSIFEVEIDLVVMNGNLYKVVIALMFGVCCLYAIDNPTPQHVMDHWETYITLNMLEYENR
jgi:hypothetical protein